MNRHPSTETLIVTAVAVLLAFPTLAIGQAVSAVSTAAGGGASNQVTKPVTVLDAATEALIIALDDTSITFKGEPRTISGRLMIGDLFVAQGKTRQVLVVHSFNGNTVVETIPPEEKADAGKVYLRLKHAPRDVKKLDAATQALIIYSDDTSIVFKGTPDTVWYGGLNMDDLLALQGKTRKVRGVTVINDNAVVELEPLEDGLHPQTASGLPPGMVKLDESEKPQELDAEIQKDIIGSDDTSITFRGEPEGIFHLQPGEVFSVQGKARRVRSLVRDMENTTVETEAPGLRDWCTDTTGASSHSNESTMTLMKGVQKLDATTRAAIVVSDDTAITFKGMPAAITVLKPGDIVLVETEAFLTENAARRVLSVATVNGNTVLQTERPEMAEVFEIFSVHGASSLLPKAFPCDKAASWNQYKEWHKLPSP